jgi:hypothetical protein
MFGEVVLSQFPAGLLICRNHRTESLSVDVIARQAVLVAHKGYVNPVVDGTMAS